jgi:hypothetical protein
MVRFARIALGLVALAIFTQFATAQSQTWERLIAPGLTYRMEIDLGLPRVIHAFRYIPGSGSVFSRPELAGSAIYLPDDETKGRAPLTTIIESTGALAGINADFFPWSGDPIGAMVRHGELISLPYPKRAVFAWGNKYVATSPWETTLTYKTGTVLRTIDGLNQEAGDNTVTLFTPISAFAKSSVAGIYATIKCDSKLPVNGMISGTVELITPDLKTSTIKANQLLLVGTGNQKTSIAGLQVGETITFSTSTKGVDANKVVHAVAGAPRLLAGGKMVLNATAEGLADSFSSTLHPRTAVGTTASGDVYLVVIDGRQPMSRGASLDELAKVMQRLGCVEAINLDGGGSSTLAVGSLVLNRPSDGSERAISNALLLFGPRPAADPEADFVIKGVPQLEEGTTATYSLVNSKGERVPLHSVIWAAQGSAWIDQAGVLRPIKPGNVKVSAFIGGVIASVEVEVVAKPTVPPPAQRNQN